MCGVFAILIYKFYLVDDNASMFILNKSACIIIESEKVERYKIQKIWKEKISPKKGLKIIALQKDWLLRRRDQLRKVSKLLGERAW